MPATDMAVRIAVSMAAPVGGSWPGAHAYM
jgi:hypothetical protein